MRLGLGQLFAGRLQQVIGSEDPVIGGNRLQEDILLVPGVAETGRLGRRIGGGDPARGAAEIVEELVDAEAEVAIILVLGLLGEATEDHSLGRLLPGVTGLQVDPWPVGATRLLAPFGGQLRREGCGLQTRVLGTGQRQAAGQGQFLPVGGQRREEQDQGQHKAYRFSHGHLHGV